MSASAPLWLTTISPSSSVTVTVRVSDALSYSLAVSASTVVCVIFVLSPATLLSSSARTVIVCAVFQFDCVNTRSWLSTLLVPLLRTKERPPLCTLTFTFPVGRTLSFTL